MFAQFAEGVINQSLQFVRCAINGLVNALRLFGDCNRLVLFEARFGEIAEDNTPAFLSPAGELLAVPSFLTEGFRQALNGSRCRTCRHRSHLEKVAPIVLPPGLLQTLRLPVAHPTPAEK